MKGVVPEDAEGYPDDLQWTVVDLVPAVDRISLCTWQTIVDDKKLAEKVITDDTKTQPGRMRYKILHVHASWAYANKEFAELWHSLSAEDWCQDVTKAEESVDLNPRIVVDYKLNSYPMLLVFRSTTDGYWEEIQRIGWDDRETVRNRLRHAVDKWP